MSVCADDDYDSGYFDDGSSVSQDTASGCNYDVSDCTAIKYIINKFETLKIEQKTLAETFALHRYSKSLPDKDKSLKNRFEQVNLIQKKRIEEYWKVMCIYIQGIDDVLISFDYTDKEYPVNFDLSEIVRFDLKTFITSLLLSGMCDKTLYNVAEHLFFSSKTTRGNKQILYANNTCNIKKDESAEITECNINTDLKKQILDFKNASKQLLEDQQILMMNSKYLMRNRYSLFHDDEKSSLDQYLERNRSNVFFGTSVSSRFFARKQDDICILSSFKVNENELNFHESLARFHFQKIKDSYVHRRYVQHQDPEYKSLNYDHSKHCLETTVLKSHKIFWFALFNLLNGAKRFSYEKLTIEGIERVIDDHENGVTHNPPGIEDSCPAKVHIFLGDVHCGKSSYLSWLGWHLQNLNKLWWVLRFNAVEYETFFNQLLKSDIVQTMSETQAMRILYQMTCLAILFKSINNKTMHSMKNIEKEAEQYANLLSIFNGEVVVDEGDFQFITSLQLSDMCDKTLYNVAEHLFFSSKTTRGNKQILYANNTCNIKKDESAEITECNINTDLKKQILDLKNTSKQYSSCLDDGKLSFHQYLKRDWSNVFFGTSVSSRFCKRKRDIINILLSLKDYGNELDFNESLAWLHFKKIKDSYVHRHYVQQQDPEYKSLNYDHSKHCLETTVLKSRKISWIALFNLLNGTKRFSYEKLTIEGIERVIDDYENGVTHNPPGIEDSCPAKVHIFLGEAHCGKSSYLSWLGWYLQNLNKSWWVLRFNALEYQTFFNQLLKSDIVQTMSETQAMRILYQMTCLAILFKSINNKTMHSMKNIEKEAEQYANLLSIFNGEVVVDEGDFQNKINCPRLMLLLRLFTEKFNQRCLILLFDDFDKINADFKNIVKVMLFWFEKMEGVRTIYYTSRTCEVSDGLKTIFRGGLFYSLKPFSRKDQLVAIHTFLKNNFSKYFVHDQFLYLLGGVQILLELHVWNIPCFIPKVLEILKGFINGHVDFNNGAIDTIVVNKSMEMFEKLRFTEQYVNEHNLTNYTSSLFQKEAFDLVCARVAHKESEYFKNNHQTFAKYVAALWLFNNRNHEEATTFMKSFNFWEEDKKEMREYFDRMLIRESGSKPIHMAVLNNHYNEVEKMLIEDKSKLNETDVAGRTTLHLMVIYWQGNSIAKMQNIIRSANCLKTKDELLNWKALDYAMVLCEATTIKVLSDSFHEIDTNELDSMLLRCNNEEMIYKAATYERFILKEVYGNKKNIVFPNIDLINKMKTLRNCASRDLIEYCISIDTVDVIKHLLKAVGGFEKLLDRCSTTVEAITSKAFENEAFDVIKYLFNNFKYDVFAQLDNETLLTNVIKTTILNHELFEILLTAYYRRKHQNNKNPAEYKNYVAESNRTKLTALTNTAIEIDQGILQVLRISFLHNNEDALKSILNVTKVAKNSLTLRAFMQNVARKNHSNEFFEDCLIKLVDHTNDLHMKDEQGMTLLHFAIQNKLYRVAQHLIEEKEFNVEDKDNVNLWNSLHYCVSGVKPYENVKLMSFFKYLLNITDGKRYLLDEDRKARNVSDLAIVNRCFEVAKYISELKY